MRQPPVQLDQRTAPSGLQQSPRDAAVPATRRASVDRAWRSALVACLLCFGALGFGALADTAAAHRERAEPSRAGAPRSWARAMAAALGAALVAFAALAGTPAQAQEITTFFTNAGAYSAKIRNVRHVAQGVHTGRNRGGYTLTEVRPSVTDAGRANSSLSIRKGRPDGTEIATLQYSATVDAYAAPPNTVMDPDTTYYFKFNPPPGYAAVAVVPLWSSYTSGNEWNLFEGYRFRNSENLWLTANIDDVSHVWRMAVMGYRNAAGPNRPPTSANGRIAAEQGRDSVLGRSDFSYSDPDVLDPLSGLEITSLPDSGDGTLKLNGTPLTGQDLPKTVTRTELDSGKLVYTPPSGQPEENIASFGFKVSDGMATSDLTYTMSISLVPSRAVLLSVEPTSTPTRRAGGTGSESSELDTYGYGDILEITATFDSGVTVSGNPEFLFRYRGDRHVGENYYFLHAQYDRVRSAAAGRNKVVFTYRVTDTSKVTPGHTGIQIVRKAPCCTGHNPFYFYPTGAIDSASGGGSARLGIANDAVHYGHKLDARLGGQAPENRAPTSAVGRVTATQGVDFAFSVSDFGYQDDDEDLLAAITIVSPPVVGELLLDGSAVAAGASVTSTELDEGALTYRAPEETTGADVASFTFKVSDSRLESVAEYVMNIDVQASAQQVEGDPPTIDGTPGVSGAGDDGRWAQGETVRVTVPFSEAVAVDTSGGTPSVGIGLGATAARSAAYQSGSGTAELVFGYTLVDGDGAHTVMAVTPDSLALNGGAIRSVATSADAALGHNGTLVLASPPSIPDGPKARFEGLPEQHNGTTAFTVELHFSAEPEGLSYRTVQDGLLEVEGATVTRAARTTRGSNLGWRVTVAPSGDGDVQIRLPARSCGEPNAVCIGGRPLEQAAQATIPGTAQVEPPPPVPLTASFSGTPTEHDGTSPFELQLRLSEEPAGLSYRTVQSGLFNVSGGTIGRAWRLVRGNNAGWGLRVEPSGFGDVTLALRATTDCAGTPGVCTSDGRMLGGGLQARIAGPPTLAVADAQIEEGSDVTLDFAVSLSRTLTETVTVGYRTEDGTASAGADYTATTGTLTFAAGDTSKTVSVPVLDDAHDEGSETMTLRLQSPSPTRVKLADAEATGTINNHDAMPRAWMVRFGRTVGSQVVDALTQRLEGAGGSHVTVAGINVVGAKAEEPILTDDDPFGLPDWVKNAEREADAQTITADDILLRSAFHLSSGRDAMQGGGPAFTAWGRVATGGFEAAEEDHVTMSGDVTTGLVGFDAEWERALAGIMFSQSSGEGSYRLDPELGSDAGTVESSLTGFYPYARIDLNAKVSAWALAGIGSGELTLHQEGGKPMPTDISMRMGAIGVKGQVLDGTGASGLGVNVKSDAMWVGTKSADTSELAPTRGDVTRLRLILQGERVFEADNGATFTPSAEIGLRQDGGDAETGTGVEVGAGLRYTAGPLTIEGQVRSLVAHEDSDYEEWGMSGAIRVTPSSSGRGLTLSIAPAWGRTGSAADRLWSAHDARELGADSEFEADSRIAIDTGYGFGLPHGHGVLTPYTGMTLGDAGTRTMRAGTRWQLSPDVVVGLEATRQTSDAGEDANELRLRAALRF